MNKPTTMMPAAVDEKPEKKANLTMKTLQPINPDDMGDDFPPQEQVKGTPCAPCCTIQ